MTSIPTPDEKPLHSEALSNYHTTEIKTWIGGFRSAPTDWNEPRNWFPSGVPDWNNKVIIGGYGRHHCTISTEEADISGLLILPQAALQIKPEGRLTIDGLLADPLGIMNDGGLDCQGNLKNDGELHFRNFPVGAYENTGRIVNTGLVTIDHSLPIEGISWGTIMNSGQFVGRPFRFL